MYKVVVSNQCSCFKNSKMDGTLHFESREEAKNKALEMMKKMNEDFVENMNLMFKKCLQVMLFLFIILLGIIVVGMVVACKQQLFFWH